jgi:dTDP-glucose 4,6-dehydratase
MVGDEASSANYPPVSRAWLITGGLGFIGSHFIRLVLRERTDVRVVNLDAVTYAGNRANLADVEGNPRYRFIHGDICDAAALDEALGGGVEAVVNFAAESHVDRSILGAEAFLRTNVLGTHVLLEEARRKDVARFLQVSTDEVYGSIPSGRSGETAPLSPSSPYAASKAGAELLVLAHGATHGKSVLVTRGSNTYGPHQHPEKLIPLFATNLLEGKAVPLYGDGSHVRDWLHVDDHARGILDILERGREGNVYNLGGGNLRTNLQIAERLLELCGGLPSSQIRLVTDRPNHDRRYSLDSEKAETLGWRPRRNFEEGLSATVDWYREHEDWWRTIKAGAFSQYYETQYAGR